MSNDKIRGITADVLVMDELQDLVSPNGGPLASPRLFGQGMGIRRVITVDYLDTGFRRLLGTVTHDHPDFPLAGGHTLRKGDLVFFHRGGLLGTEPSNRRAVIDVASLIDIITDQGLQSDLANPPFSLSYDPGVGASKTVFFSTPQLQNYQLKDVEFSIQRKEQLIAWQAYSEMALGIVNVDCIDKVKL